MKMKKRALSAVLALLLGLLLLPSAVLSANAATFFEEGDFRFAVTSGDTVSVAQYLGSDTAVALPATAGSRAVTGVYQKCFENTDITSVQLPEGYTFIGAFAFNGCTALTTVALPSTLCSIGVMAFNGCTALQQTDLEDTATESLGFAAFNGCTALETALLPDALTQLGENAFCGCASLQTLRLPQHLTAIPEYAFYGCAALTAVTFPAAVSTIGEGAFENTGLTAVYVPDTVTAIGANAFAPGDSVVCFEGSAAAAYCADSAAGNARVLAKITGDATLDGKVTISDVTAIQRYLAELAQFAEYQTLLADVTGDSEVRVDDASMIQSLLAEFITEFPV